MKELDERIDESVLWWFIHTEKVENNKITENVYKGECMGSRPRNRWIDSLNDYLEKRSLNVG